MSTLRSRMRLLKHWFVLGLFVPLAVSLAGCASTSRLGSNASSKMKTFLAVGDKPLPVVGGEPGSSVAADQPEPLARPSKVRPVGRISGRVYDADGRPVPDARVRLAVSGAAGGKVVRASTDRSGAFTLKGLVPGASYTVIAEWEGNEGLESGRAVAKANDTNVKISLGVPDDAGSRAAAPRSNKVNRVSDREQADDGETETPGDVTPGGPDPDATPPRRTQKPARGTGSEPASDAGPVNEEDLPPAPEAEALASPSDPGEGRSVAQAPGPKRVTAPDARWRRGDPGRPAALGDEPSGPGDAEGELTTAQRPSTPRAPIDAEARGTGATAPEGSSEPPADDGPNPLPPALEPGRDGGVSFDPVPAQPPAGADPFAADVPRLAAAAPPLGTARRASANRSPSTSSSTTSSSPFDSPSRPTVNPRPATPPEEVAPGALVATPETFAPIVLSEDPFGTEPKPKASKRAKPAAAPAPAASNSVPVPDLSPSRPSRRRPTRPAASSSDDAAGAELPPPAEAVALGPQDAAPSDSKIEAGSVIDDGPGKEVAKPKEPRRPTWGDVATNTSLPPLEEGATPTAAPAPVHLASVARREPAGKPQRGGLFGQPRAAAAVADDAAVKPACDYDDRHRRLLDFNLPDLDGKPVRFQDLDADLVLLDFWGTWCPPCMKSIPHLVDLQTRAGGKRLVIVGVACEKEPPDQSSKRLAATVDQLKINYPILVSRNDGSCPLQEALHIQAFPTMVLLDRQGRVLWRDQGATPATLARLDRMISDSTKGDETRRY